MGVRVGGDSGTADTFRLCALGDTDGSPAAAAGRVENIKKTIPNAIPAPSAVRKPSSVRCRPGDRRPWVCRATEVSGAISPPRPNTQSGYPLLCVLKPTLRAVEPSPPSVGKDRNTRDKEESVAGKLRSPGEPQSGVATWSKLRTLADESEALAVRQARAATTVGNAKAFVDTVKKLTPVLAKLDKEGRAGGFTGKSACSTLFG